MPSSIGYEATILEVDAPAASFVNTTGTDMTVGTIQYLGKLLFVVVGPSSSDGSTIVASAGGVGSMVCRPGVRVLYSCFTTDSPGMGAALYWDSTTKRLTTNATATFPLAGVAAQSKAAGVATIDFYLNQTPAPTVIAT